MLTVLDEYTRQALAVTVRTRMGVEDVLEALYPLLLRHGTPEYIRSDNGPVFIAQAMQDWLARVGIKPIRIHPGRTDTTSASTAPCANEVLNAEWFTTTKQAQIVINQWLRQPHPSTSGPQHATTSPGNSCQEWHRTCGIDSRDNRDGDLIGFLMKVQYYYRKLRQFLHLSIIGIPSKNLFIVLL